MSSIVNMLCSDLLNRPGLLVALILGVMVIVVGLVAFLIMLPKIKKSAALKLEQRKKDKEKAAEDRQKESEFATKMLSEKDAPIRKDLKQGEIDNIVDTIQHNRKEPNAKVEMEKKENDKHKEALSNDVISIMQGGVSSASAFKKADAFEIKQEKEKAKVDEAKSEKRVEGVLNVLGNTPSAKVEVKKEAKPKAAKTAGSSTAKKTTSKKESK